MTACLVPGCMRRATCRGACAAHYERWSRGTLVGYDGSPIELLASQNELRWDCTCPDARHDDWECPTCFRPPYSPDRIAAMGGRR